MIKKNRNHTIVVAAEKFICRLETETLVESVYTSAGVNELLLSGEERMTLRANIQTDVLLGGAGLELCAASTSNNCFFVIRVNALFHALSLLSKHLNSITML